MAVLAGFGIVFAIGVSSASWLAELVTDPLAKRPACRAVVLTITR